MNFTNLRCTAAIILLLCSLTASGQGKFEYTWDVVPMDDRWDAITDSTATKLIAAYDSILAPLYEVVGVSDKQYDKERPESGLSNFIADAIRRCAEKADGRHVNLALTNFGGIRTSLPQGNVTMYDMLSIFPFINYLVVFEISGRDLYTILNRHAGRPEAMSGVRIVVDGGKIASLDIDGTPIDTNRTYVMASINFLMSGGDDFCLDRYAKNIREYKDILIRDAVVDAIRETMAEKNIVSLEKDGRTIVK